jgi:hypothetical protein
MRREFSLAPFVRRAQILPAPWLKFFDTCQRQIGPYSMGQHRGLPKNKYPLPRAGDHDHFVVPGRGYRRLNEGSCLSAAAC